MDGPRSPDIARLVRVAGRVQGVGFRAWTAAEARARGLAGFVRNLPDGSVEALVAGPPGPVGAMLEALGRGPAAARVRSVRALPAAPGDAPRPFEIRR